MLVYYIYIIVLFLLAIICKVRPFIEISQVETEKITRGRHTIVIKADSATFLSISSILLFVLIAFRGVTVGTDTMMYYNQYKAINSISFPNTFTDFIRGEYGYKFIIYLLSHIGISWIVFQILYAALVCVATKRFIGKYSKDILSSLILFVTVGSFSMALTGIRQTIAISLLLLAYLAADEKKWFLFALCYTASITVHYTAFIFIVTLFTMIVLNSGKQRTKLWLVIGLILPILFYFFTGYALQRFSSLLLRKYEFSGYYTTLNNELNPIVFIMYWTMFLFVFVCLLLKNDICSKNDLVFYVLASLFLGCYEASRSVYMMNRLSFFFAFFFIISVSNAVNYLPIKVTQKRVVSILICCLCVLAFAISTPGSSYGIDKYVFWGQ